MSADSKEVLGRDMGAVVPVTDKTEAGTPIHSKGDLPPGHTAVDFNAVGPVRPPMTPAGSGMTTDHPAFGGPKSAATPPRWKP